MGKKEGVFIHFEDLEGFGATTATHNPPSQGLPTRTDVCRASLVPQKRLARREGGAQRFGGYSSPRALALVLLQEGLRRRTLWA